MRSALQRKSLVAAACVTMLAAWLTACSGGGGTSGQYPSKTITLITHSKAGSGGDLFGRPFAQFLGDELGVGVQVENRPGGGTGSAMQALAQAKPDGYTLMIVNDGYLTNPVVTPEITYDAIGDLTMIARVAVEPTVIVVKSDSRFQTWNQLADDLRANPQRWGIQNVANADGVVYFGLKAAFPNIEDLPYEDGPGAVSALLAGDIEVTIAGLNEVDSLTRSGDLRILATATGERIPAPYDSVPTLKESGVDVVFDKHRGIAGPPGMPAEQVQTLQNAIKAVVDNPEYVESLSSIFAVPAYLPADQYSQLWVNLDKQYRQILQPAS